MCTEPPFFRAPHCGEFRPTKGAFNLTWRCPVTGVVMLEPSFLRYETAGDFKGLSQWEHSAGYWQENQRGVQDIAADNSSSMAILSTQKAAGASFGGLLLSLVNVAIVGIRTNTAAGNNLVWALESKFSLEADEGFVIHYHGLQDEMARKDNWFAVQFDDIYLHFSQTGVVRAYQYDRADMTSAPVLRDEFEVASPSELLQRVGYFVLLPIPGLGLAVYHSRISQRPGGIVTNAFQGVTRGHLIPWPSRTIGGNLRLFDSSVVRFAFNPGQTGHSVGFQNLTYPLSGTYTDDVFDPHFTPTALPAEVIATPINTPYQAITAALRNPADTAAWAVGTNRQGRVRCTLTTASMKHTPFLYAYGVRWAAIFATRNTTPLVLGNESLGKSDVLQRLEFTEDETGQFAGVANARLETAAGRLIAERGDCTWHLEKSEDGQAWDTVSGGLASLAQPFRMVITNVGLHYDTLWNLHDMRQRLTEVNQHREMAFDGYRLDVAVNAALQSGGMAPIADADVPAPIKLVFLPRTENNKTWQMASRAGDNTEDITEKWLFLLRKQNAEYLLVYNWDLAKMEWQAKPRDTTALATWTLTFYEDEHDPANRIIFIGSELTANPTPPVFNILQVFGKTEKDDEKLVPVQPLINSASLTNTASPDYLGRAKMAVLPVVGLTDEAELAKVARRVEAIDGHRVFDAWPQIPRYVEGLAPNTQVILRGPNASGVRSTLFTLWIKRRVTIIDHTEGMEDMALHISSTWEGPLPS